MLKSSLKKVASSVIVTDYEDYRTYLQNVYWQIKSTLETYSYKEFSADLEMGSGNAYSIVQGKRALSEKGAWRIVEQFGLVKNNKKYFLALVKRDHGKSAEERAQANATIIAIRQNLAPTTLDQKRLQYFTKWYNVAIRELLSIEGASDDPHWIKATLKPKVSLAEVREALNLLKDLKYLKYSKERKRWVPSDIAITTGNEPMGNVIYQYHDQMLEIAKLSMRDVSPSERDISAITVNIPANIRDLFKQEIVALRKRLLKIANENDQPCNEVVQINIQMFPVAKLRKDD